MRVLIIGGSSDSTTMPTSQNQLVTIAPHHSRGSTRKWRIIAAVEVAILAEILRPGAASPVAGISCADSQPAGERKTHDQGRKEGVAPFAARSEAAGNGPQKNGHKSGAFHQCVADR